MTFLSLVIVLLLVQWWGSGKPLQRDEWFYRWWQWLQAHAGERLPAGAVGFLAVACPSLVLLGLVLVIGWYLPAVWLLLVNVPVLLYSLGRGEFSQSLQKYLEAARADNSVRAAQVLDEMNLDPGLRCEREGDNWMQLHQEALRVFSYRGFERMFAVLFWFLVAGAVGALVYRLVVLLRAHLLEQNDPAARSVNCAAHWLEWPAARLMGVSWALVGNFEACIKPWRQYCLDTRVSTPVYLAAVLSGALGDERHWPDSDAATTQGARIEPAYSLQLVAHTGAMFSRALLLWVFAAALIILIV
ncbi:regulatory signaling modulator protein AmpE [Gilvimarinus algae]|uniref:Regulatory signaling modulator protein AmpE n=1 Tax=Gilvimarinus algae TaxID=3058037 RepID=A0ABT8TFF8_9GAMM|nr:regulatory signaling modulator protein AmpE [Gilvimarinus sp. SDUM040014]MDO3382835.1 regulatory signaling modulator protein AmpE [Gilvimarinus sp. SDUM040014]